MLKYIFCCVLLPQYLFAQSIDSSAVLASQYFKEAREISNKDNGRLWGKNLYGPMIFVDINTGKGISNEPDSANTFTKAADVFMGSVPRSFGSNTARIWGGKIWTVILWPLPKDKYERAYVMMHELFHQLQKNIGLPDYNTISEHLDKFDGRLLLKLELEALRKVINDYPAFSREDLQNAISLRQYRYQKFPLADSIEHALEFNEGLATFTGFILSGNNMAQSKATINKQVDEFYKNETFVRSLGYITGYMYGFLLSQNNHQWNRPISEESFLKRGVTYNSFKERASFDKLILKLYRLKLPSSLPAAYNAIVLSGKYNFRSIYTFEKAREEKQLAIEKENKRKFIDGPVLELPNKNMNINFNPNEVQVLEGYGPVYPTLTCKADWGLLEVKNGGALVKDWMFVYVPLPKNFDSKQRTVLGEGWQLDLKDGWSIIEDRRKGDYKIVKQ
jgi:hypothetical protein